MEGKVFSLSVHREIRVETRDFFGGKLNFEIKFGARVETSSCCGEKLKLRFEIPEFIRASSTERPVSGLHYDTSTMLRVLEHFSQG